MTYSVPEGWHHLADEIATALLEVATEGMWSINVENPLYEDLYIQGLWDEEDVIWLEIGNPDAQEAIQIVTGKGWSEPDEEIPNYFIEKGWSDDEVDDVVDFLIETFILIGLSPELITLEIRLDDER
ncbi:MAG: hypothetical protein ACK5CU_03480 [Rhodoluna sp.]|jgi:hypothetical protein